MVIIPQRDKTVNGESFQNGLGTTERRVNPEYRDHPPYRLGKNRIFFIAF
jgi:hypothetical protein